MPCAFASSRMSSLDPATCWPARYFAIAPTSPNVSLRSRSLSETSMPLPVMPFCRATHSGSVKSVFVAIPESPFVLHVGRISIMADQGWCRTVVFAPPSAAPATSIGRL